MMPRDISVQAPVAPGQAATKDAQPSSKVATSPCAEVQNSKVKGIETTNY